MKRSLKQRTKDEIIRWNNKFPLDYWWRKKYNIPFGSSRHREMSFIDMYREYQEELMMKDLNKKRDPDGDIEVNNISEIPQHEIDTDFDNIDLTNY